MSKIELLDTVVAGGEAPHIPAAFWLHFVASRSHGAEAVSAQTEFFEATGVDLAKVMNENLHPNAGLIIDPRDWTAFRPWQRSDPAMRDQIDIVKRTVDALGGRARVIATIHGVVASVFHASGRMAEYPAERGTLAAHVRSEPTLMRSVYAAVADSLAMLASECLAAGADGIYYAALGGERTSYTDHEFAQFVAPHDRLVLEAAGGDENLNVLHICKEDINVDRFRDYPAAIVSWSVTDNLLSIDAGRAVFNRATLLGGVQTSASVFTAGSDAEAAELAQSAVDAVTDRRRFILGGDCTLPTSTPYSRIAAMVEVAHSNPGH